MVVTWRKAAESELASGREIINFIIKNARTHPRYIEFTSASSSICLILLVFRPNHSDQTNFLVGHYIGSAAAGAGARRRGAAMEKGNQFNFIIPTFGSSLSAFVFQRKLI